MLGKEDSPAGDEGSSVSGHNFPGTSEVVGDRKVFWRSASWSSSRTSLPPLNRVGLDHIENGEGNNIAGHCPRATRPLNFRSQNSFKSRSCLPPLQPLSIARRSLDDWPKAGSDDIGEWPLPSTPGGRDANTCGERLKLDLSNIPKTPDRNGGLAKREKIASFDKECSKVAEHIYLGGDVVAKDKDILKNHKITHILNCVGFVCPEYFKDDFIYRTLWLQDSPSEDITSILYDAFDYFEDVRELGGRVFVHCCQGVSRSTSLVIAYLMWKEGRSFDDAFQYVKAARGIADPNMGFACQLLQCQKRVHAFPLSPSSLLRMYWISSHSPYDPLHLVPKILNDPSPMALDSRGAFIIQIPSAIYVWIGKKCELIMERDARSAVCQIVRYEKVQGPIQMIKEGEETSFFWDTFSSFLTLDKSSCDIVSENKIRPGDRKVEVYNVEFEIFQKAIEGGFVPPFALSGTEHETHLPARESSWNSQRRKFVSGSMKDFVSAKKSSPTTVYPDSLFTDDRHFVIKHPHSSTNSSSSSSSSSSPLYFSPDSISSDASFVSASLENSPDTSPLAAAASSHSEPASSVLSDLSSLTLCPSISKSSKFIDVNFDSKSCLRSVSTPCKKLALDMTGCRGVFLKKKLPLPASGDIPLGRDLENNSAHISRTDSNCILVKCGDMQDLSPCTVSDANKHRVNHHHGEEDFVVLNGSETSYFIQPLVYRWPSLEKMTSFDRTDLDSNSAFIFITPSCFLEKTGGRALYLWVGRFFRHNETETCSRGNENIGECAAEVERTLVNSNVLSLVGLPMDIKIEIVEENEEPAEFMSMLSLI